MLEPEGDTVPPLEGLAEVVKVYVISSSTGVGTVVFIAVNDSESPIQAVNSHNDAATIKKAIWFRLDFMIETSKALADYCHFLRSTSKESQPARNGFNNSIFCRCLANPN